MIYSILALLLIILKLVGIVSWEWWIILIPLWGPFALITGLLLLLILFLLCIACAIQVLEWLDK